MTSGEARDLFRSALEAATLLIGGLGFDDRIFACSVSNPVKDMALSGWGYRP